MKLKSVILVSMLLLSSLALLVPASAEEGSPAPMDIQPMGTQRVVLVELMTGAWCGPCVNANKGLQMVEDNYERDEIVILAYHSSDALSNAESNERLSFYNPSGIPHARFDGVGIAHGSAGTPQQNYNRYVNLYNQRTTISSPFRMTVEWDYNDITGEGDAWVNITAVDTPTLTNLKLHTAVFEMNYGPYNGGNGENWHNWTAHDFLESQGAAGATVDLTQGEDMNVYYSFDTSSYAQDKEQVGIIAFVQSHSTKEVLQAAYVNVPVLPNVPPVIHSGQAIVPDGTTEDDEVTFKVFYYDTDDRKDKGPAEAKVMFKNDTSTVLEGDLVPIPSGQPWTMGKWLQYKTTLGPGTYSFKFSASDGEDDALGDVEWNATTFNILPRNKVPKLATHSYSPLEGDTNTEFRFEVMYRDMDDDPPTEANIVIDDVPYGMSTDETETFTDWVTYYYDTTLAVGDNHRFFFTFSDGEDSARLPAVDDSPNWIRGPTVVKPNNAPTLTTALFDPDEGTRMDDFTFTIIYTDGENDHPTVSYIYIDEVPYIMDPDGFTYDNGETFRYRTSLDMGEHNIRFLFNDGKNEVRFPASGTLPGPTVSNMDPEGVIAAPTDGIRYTPDDYVPFSAVGSDDPEGDALEYKWTSSIDGVLSTQQSFDKRLSEGEHVITLEVTDEYGGIHTATVEINVKPLVPEPVVVGHTSNNDAPVEMDMVRYTFTLDNIGEATAQGIEVKFFVDDDLVNSDTLTISVGNEVEVRFTWKAVEGPHNVRLEVPGDSYEFTERVSSNTAPDVTTEIVNEGGKDVKHKAGTELYFQASASDANGDTLTYLWDFGDGITSTQENPSHIYAEKGTYKVTLTVTDARGDTVTDTFDIEIGKEKSEGGDSPGFGALVAVVAMMAVIVVLSRRRL